MASETKVEDAGAVFAKAAKLALKTPKPDGITFGYGTAGFRAVATTLPSTFLRVGMLAALRGMHTGQVVGVMITASHNAAPDNGVKMVDPDGGMLSQSWEKYAVMLANAADDAVAATLATIASAEGIDTSAQAVVKIAKDTRPSSEELAALTREGALSLGADVIDYGLLTTPQLHHIVRMTNKGKDKWASEAGYFDMLKDAYAKITEGATASNRGTLYVDGACGVGALKTAALNEAMGDMLTIEGRNNVDDGELNHLVGAEHAQKSRTPPAGFDATADANRRLASYDGDADRIVYHYFDSDGGWHLLDGDKLAALCATFFAEHISELGLTMDPERAEDANFVSVAVVQTAYANGASRNYIQNTLNLPVPLTKTGVKFLHHKALEYEIGIYFEANGHGTVVFADSFIERLDKMTRLSLTPSARNALMKLLAAVQLINQAVGDAMSDALFIEAILTLKNWSVQDWDAIYGDLPSRQTKLRVADRTVVKTTADETAVIEPAELQAAIDAAAAAVPQGRAFCRPSGTEDVVRVYAEAATEEQANALAGAVAVAVHTHAGGVGPKPDPTAFTA